MLLERLGSFARKGFIVPLAGHLFLKMGLSRQEVSLSGSVDVSRKMRKTGSVEKCRVQEEHEVVSQHDEGEFADFSPATSRPDVVSKSPFDHRDDGFDLSSLVVGFAVNANLHQALVPPGGWFAGGASMLGWKDSAAAKFFTVMTMIGLAVVACVSYHTAELRPLGSFGDQRSEFIGIRLGTLGCGKGEDEVVAGTADERELGNVAVYQHFPRVSHSIPTCDEIVTRGSAFQPCRTNRRVIDRLASS
jgi:hypothetical protein